LPALTSRHPSHPKIWTLTDLSTRIAKASPDAARRQIQPHSETRNQLLANVRYKTGVDTFLNVYVAETALFSDQQALISLRVQQMTSSVQLIEALGGGWDADQLPSVKDVTSAHSAQ
jgi:outer membrane protein TolC